MFYRNENIQELRKLRPVYYLSALFLPQSTGRNAEEGYNPRGDQIFPEEL
jgi:hypothetical protein